ncbi:MAG TPA: tRNA (N6-isopentenyl adenosine(37)-C2)-methylthiotransferase MiaB, partial [Caulobacteraceae bacterium]
AMNRGHAAEAYLRTLEAVRAARPDIAISGDFIVGFPGERETDFEATLALAREVGYASAFSFKYSRRPGTPGAAMGGQVAEADKEARLARLQDVLNHDRHAFNSALVGRAVPVLFERPGRHPGQLSGRSPYLQAVHCEGPASLVGQVETVVIRGAGANSLAAERVLETA